MNANFVTCEQCGSQLVILRTDESVSTERLDRLEAAGSEMAELVALLSFRQALDQLDKEWDEVRLRYVARTREGREILPSLVAISWLGLATLTMAGTIVAIFLGRSEFVVVGSVVSAIAILFCFIANDRRLKFEQAYADYLARRDSLEVDDFLP